MKKTFLIILIIMFALCVACAFYACNNNEEPEIQGYTGAEFDPNREIVPPYTSLAYKGVEISAQERTDIYNLYRTWVEGTHGPGIMASEDFIYYGEFNQFHVLMFENFTDGLCYGDAYFCMWRASDIENNNIDGLYFSNANYICAIDRNGVGGRLKEIYGQGYFTREEIEEIYKIHVAVHAERYFVDCNEKNLTCEEYKEFALAEIRTLAESKAQNAPEKITNILNISQIVINSAQSVHNIYSIKMTMLALLDAIGSQLEKGIEISNETRGEILDEYANWAEANPNVHYTHIGDENFFFYGQYNGFYITMHNGWYGALHEEFIDGLDFSNPGTGEIYAVGSGIGGTLKEIYEQGYLTRAELEEIHKIHIRIYANEIYTLLVNNVLIN